MLKVLSMQTVKSKLSGSQKDVSLTEWQIPYQNIKVTIQQDTGRGINIIPNVNFNF